MGSVGGVPEQELLSLEAAAEFLYVSKSTMYLLLNQGKLRGMPRSCAARRPRS